LLALEARAGDTILAARDLYGATHTLLQQVFSTLGLRVVTAEMEDVATVAQRCQELRPRAVLLETMSNPLLRVADVPAIITAAHEAGARVLVDNTFATPYLCRPLQWGADAVVHSVTKYLAGHGDVTAGVVAAGADLATPLSMTLRLTGGVLSPFESWLALRGLKTLPLRMRQHCAGALAVATWLEQHPQVARVYYPGLASHPDHAVACKLFGERGAGGVVAFDLREATRAAAFAFLHRLRLVLPATTLGDVASLALYPAMSSHRGLSPQARRASGIGDGLIRLAVGIEDVADITADLDQALRGI
jgi:cystathionine gamma-synthase/methionine-gamma-lyase